MDNRGRSFLYVAVTLSLMTIAARSVNNMTSTTLPLLGKYVLGFNNFDVGLLSFFLSLFVFFATSTVNPRLSSKVRRSSFILSNGLITSLLVAFPFSSQYTIWFLSALLGFASGLVMPNLITAASLAQDQRSVERLLALYSTSLSLSLIVGPLIETTVLHLTGSYGEVFLVFVPLALLAFFLSWTVSFPDVRREVRGGKVLNNHSFLASILTITTYNIPFAAFNTFLAIYPEEMFKVNSSIGYATFIPFFTVSFMTRILMTLRPFRDLRRPLILSVTITVLGILGMTISHTFLTFIAFVALLGIPHGSIFPMATIMISRGTTREERNAINSYFLAYNNILFFAVPPIVGYLSSFLGLSLAFALLDVPVLVSALMLYRTSWGEKFMIGAPIVEEKKREGTAGSRTP